jgi:predicted metal-dependent hydrolase
MEAPAVAVLPGGPVPYTLRHSARARTLRVVIHPERGVVVTIPAGRVSRADGERHAEEFLAAREPWVRRHLERFDRIRADLSARGGARDGGLVRYRGALHRVRVEPAPVGVARSSVERVGGEHGDELVIRRGSRERRTDAAILESWLRTQARAAIAHEVERHGSAMGVVPVAVALRDPRSRWGSASRHGRLSFSWRLVLAPPEALDTVVVHELAHLRVFGHGPRFWSLVETQRPDHRTWRRWLHDHATELHGALGPG